MSEESIKLQIFRERVLDSLLLAPQDFSVLNQMEYTLEQLRATLWSSQQALGRQEDQNSVHQEYRYSMAKIQENTENSIESMESGIKNWIQDSWLGPWSQAVLTAKVLEIPFEDWNISDWMTTASLLIKEHQDFQTILPMMIEIWLKQMECNNVDRLMQVVYSVGFGLSGSILPLIETLSDNLTLLAVATPEQQRQLLKLCKNEMQAFASEDSSLKLQGLRALESMGWPVLRAIHGLDRQRSWVQNYREAHLDFVMNKHSWSQLFTLTRDELFLYPNRQSFPMITLLDSLMQEGVLTPWFQRGDPFANCLSADELKSIWFSKEMTHTQVESFTMESWIRIVETQFLRHPKAGPSLVEHLKVLRERWDLQLNTPMGEVGESIQKHRL